MNVPKTVGFPTVLYFNDSEGEYKVVYIDEETGVWDNGKFSNIPFSQIKERAFKGRYPDFTKMVYTKWFREYNSKGEMQAIPCTLEWRK